MASCVFCGPKSSVLCCLISVWGFIMLPIMGVLLQKRSLTFAEDLIEDIEAANLTDFIHQVDEKYDNAAVTCYIAGAIYLGTFAISLWQVYMNKRANQL